MEGGRPSCWPSCVAAPQAELQCSRPCVWRACPLFGLTQALTQALTKVLTQALTQALTPHMFPSVVVNCCHYIYLTLNPEFLITNLLVIATLQADPKP